MHWTRAAETAAQIAAEWTGEGGPGGAILLFDENELRAEACGGLALIEHALPFGAEPSRATPPSASTSWPPCCCAIVQLHSTTRSARTCRCIRRWAGFRSAMRST